MTPYVFILIAAVIGGYLHGVAGFFLWGVIAHGSLLLVGMVLQKVSGGIIPRSVRLQTAKDFVAARGELVSVAWPLHSALEQMRKIDDLLETMYRRAITECKSFHLSASDGLEHFVSSANLVVAEQKSDATRTVAKALVDFLLDHPLWYGNARKA